MHPLLQWVIESACVAHPHTPQSIVNELLTILGALRAFVEVHHHKVWMHGSGGDRYTGYGTRSSALKDHSMSGKYNCLQLATLASAGQ